MPGRHRRVDAKSNPSEERRRRAASRCPSGAHTLYEHQEGQEHIEYAHQPQYSAPVDINGSNLKLLFADHGSTSLLLVISECPCTTKRFTAFHQILLRAASNPYWPLTGRTKQPGNHRICLSAPLRCPGKQSCRRPPCQWLRVSLGFRISMPKIVQEAC